MVTFYSYIANFIFALRLGLSKPQLNYVISLIHGIILTDGRKTISNIQRTANEYRHLSCVTRFLNESPWCPNQVTQRRLHFMMNQVKQARIKNGETRPIAFMIIDDTQCKKDRSTRHMEGLDNHFSHSDSKTVWLHCIVTAHVVSEGYSFAWDFLRSYFRESYCQERGLPFKSKNELAIELIQSYKVLDHEQVYVLVDSWYTNFILMKVLLVMLKMSRSYYPGKMNSILVNRRFVF